MNTCFRVIVSETAANSFELTEVECENLYCHLSMGLGLGLVWADTIAS